MHIARCCSPTGFRSKWSPSFQNVRRRQTDRPTLRRTSERREKFREERRWPFRRVPSSCRKSPAWAMSQRKRIVSDWGRGRKRTKFRRPTEPYSTGQNPQDFPTKLLQPEHRTKSKLILNLKFPNKVNLKNCQILRLCSNTKSVGNDY